MSFHIPAAAHLPVFRGKREKRGIQRRGKAGGVKLIKKSEWGAAETIQTLSAQIDLWAIKDFKAAQFLAVERISAQLNKRETL